MVTCVPEGAGQAVTELAVDQIESKPKVTIRSPDQSSLAPVDRSIAHVVDVAFPEIGLIWDADIKAQVVLPAVLPAVSRMNELDLKVEGDTDEERAASLVDAMLGAGLSERV